MIRVLADVGAIFIDGRPVPIQGGTLQASLAGTIITIANIYGGDPIVAADFSQLADGSGNGFATPDDAMAYLAGVFAPPPSRVVEAVAASDVAAGVPLATSRATGQLVPARADTYPLAFVVGLATASVAAGFPAQAGLGALTLADWTAAVGAPVLQPGQPYFLAAAGGLTTIAVDPSAACVARVGLAASPTTLLVSLSDPILL